MPENKPNPLAPPSAEEEEKIRERAYYLWLQDGCPQGRDQEYWERARELQGIADNPDAGQMPNPATEDRSPSAEQPIEEAEIQENLGEFPFGGMRDQGDRAELPMTRHTAETTPVVNEHTPQLNQSETPPAPRAPAERAATPMPGKPDGTERGAPPHRSRGGAKPQRRKS